jgi:hypothetical protein
MTPNYLPRLGLGSDDFEPCGESLEIDRLEDQGLFPDQDQDGQGWSEEIANL